MSNRLIPAILTLALLAVGGGTLGCREAAESVPAAEMQSKTPLQATNQPTTVTGCLRAGESAEMFVLTTAQSAGEQTSTYHLVGIEGVNLAEHIGKQVEVSGVVKAQQEVATRSTTQPAGKPAPTSGTPSVSTQTDLEIKRLEVSNVREVEGRCDR